MKPSKGTLYDFLEKKYRIFYKSIDGCNSILKICNTKKYVQYRFHFYSYFWDLNPKKRKDKTKLQKLLVIVCGYLIL
jgi:hypothetical protein